MRHAKGTELHYLGIRRINRIRFKQTLLVGDFLHNIILISFIYYIQEKKIDLKAWVSTIVSQRQEMTELTV